MGGEERFDSVERVAQGRGGHAGKAAGKEAFRDGEGVVGSLGGRGAEAEDEALEGFKDEKLEAFCWSDFQTVSSVALE